VPNHFNFSVVGSNNLQGTVIRPCDFIICFIVLAGISSEGLYFTCLSSQGCSSCQEVEDLDVWDDAVVRSLACNGVAVHVIDMGRYVWLSHLCVACLSLVIFG
jgi:hypothetical protein